MQETPVRFLSREDLLEKGCQSCTFPHVQVGVLVMLLLLC